ncbi:MAG: hypothetical protein JST73_12090 [Actinobacteria bacterium]|nr:hypothetical protein [Actinomycetota bacterium]
MASTVVSITDPTRPVIRDGVEVTPQRDLPTTVWVPTGTDRLPLVVFASGYRLGPNDYARFCSTLASAGFIVAAPSFPLADASRGLGLDRGDIPNEATDVSRVVDALTSGSVDPSTSARVANGQYAVVGHSDGADVALLDGFGSGHVDQRLRAVVSIAPDAMTGGVVSSGIPLLLAQGDADTVVPYSNSRTVFGQVTGPRALMTMLGADHLPPVAGGTKWTPILDSAVATFLHHTVTMPRSPNGAADAFAAVRNGIPPGAPVRFETP